MEENLTEIAMRKNTGNPFLEDSGIFHFGGSEYTIQDKWKCSGYEKLEHGYTGYIRFTV